MNKISGIGKSSQKRITAIHNAANYSITVEEAAIILEMSSKKVAKLMSRWVKQGWFSRVKRGLYVPIKPDDRDLPREDSWVIAAKFYSPYYIGALSAAEYWGLTDQKISAVYILSTQKPRNRNPAINGTHISIRTISQQAMFGLEAVNTPFLVHHVSRLS